jgi:hypothetical protein
MIIGPSRLKPDVVKMAKSAISRFPFWSDISGQSFVKAVLMLVFCWYSVVLFSV